MVRRHPEWYVEASFDTAVMEKYSNNENVGNVYPSIQMNFETPSANGGQTYLEYHIVSLLPCKAVRLGGLSLRCGTPVDQALSNRQGSVGETLRQR